MLPGQQESVRTGSGTKESLLLLTSEANQQFQKDWTILYLLPINSQSEIASVMYWSAQNMWQAHTALLVLFVMPVSSASECDIYWNDEEIVRTHLECLKDLVCRNTLCCERSTEGFLPSFKLSKSPAEYPSQLMWLVTRRLMASGLELLTRKSSTFGYFNTEN